MDEVKVKVETLLEALRENRKNHADTLEKAIEGYTKAWEDLLVRTLAEVRNGGNVKHALSLPLPQDHRNDYDRTIKMLEMTVDEEVTITAYDFARYVMDEWEWRRVTEMSNSAYAAGSIPNL